MTRKTQRSHRAKSHQKRAWYRNIVAILRTEGGVCRLCGNRFLHQSIQAGGLRLAHLKPHSDTGHQSLREHCTLACEQCDILMSTDDWTSIVPSLTDDDNLNAEPTEAARAARSTALERADEFSVSIRKRQKESERRRQQAKFIRGEARERGGAT